MCTHVHTCLNISASRHVARRCVSRAKVMKTWLRRGKRVPDKSLHTRHLATLLFSGVPGDASLPRQVSGSTGSRIEPVIVDYNARLTIRSIVGWTNCWCAVYSEGQSANRPEEHVAAWTSLDTAGRKPNRRRYLRFGSADVSTDDPRTGK